MNTKVKERPLSTADLATAADTPAAEQEIDRDIEQPITENQNSAGAQQDEQLAPLFSPEVAQDFRSRWDTVQSSFVDDPRQAVRQGDELVAQVMKSLAVTFSNERSKLEGQLDQKDKESTENLRVALRRYRSFFERLLSL
jgi:hypothetical protein